MLERLICAVFGHRYVVERVLNHGARKVGCTRCGKHWAMHDGTRSFVPWDGEFESLYAPGGILAEASGDVTPNVELTGAARLYRAASSDQRERG
jgi:hypothetical protein